MRRLLRVLGFTAMIMTPVACSEASTTGAYVRFCDLARQMDEVSSGPHGDNPGAITDPEQMRKVWASITTIATEMGDHAPEEIATELATMLSTLFAMNDIFSANDYDLTTMARDAAIRAELDATSQDEATQRASVRFNEFVERNCPAS